MDKKNLRRLLYSIDITWIFAIAIIAPALAYVFFSFYLIEFVKHILSSPFDNISSKMIWILLSPITFVFLVLWSIKRNKQRLQFYKELEENLGLAPPKFFSLCPAGYHGIYKNYVIHYWQYDWGSKGRRRAGTKISIEGTNKNEDRLLIYLWLSSFYKTSLSSMNFSLDIDDELKPYITKESILNHFNSLGSLLHSLMFFKNGTKIIQLREEILDTNKLKQTLDLLIDFNLAF